MSMQNDVLCVCIDVKSNCDNKFSLRVIHVHVCIIYMLKITCVYEERKIIICVISPPFVFYVSVNILQYFFLPLSSVPFFFVIKLSK